MAPIGQINYLTNKSVSQAVNMLAQDITKKVCSGVVIRNKVVKAGVKRKQDYNWDEVKDEGEKANIEELGKTLRGPKCIVGVSKSIGYLKPVLKGGKRIVGVGTKGIVRPPGTRSSKKVVNIEEDDDEEEEEEAPKNIRTRSRTRSVGRGTGMVRPQGTRTSKKVVNIKEDEEDKEDEEEEVPKNIKTKNGKKVVDDKEEEKAPIYIYMKIKSGIRSIGAGKGIVRPKRIQISKKVINIKDDNEKEEEAPTYTYMKTKSRTGSVINAKDNDEEEEETSKKNKSKTGNKVVNFEVDDEEEEEEEEEEDEIPVYIKTKSRKGYVGGTKGIVGGLGSGKSKEIVKMSGVQIIRVQQEKENEEEEEEEVVEEEGQKEAEVEEDISSAGKLVESTDEVEQGVPTVKRTVGGSGGKGLGKVMQGPVKGAKRV
ncbi:hypothetical protein EV426DRAFT_707393 [Tirmania nivea]|nr:hypothetical protein EV426DRAFT_707393 [Tirmania nivea]